MTDQFERHRQMFDPMGRLGAMQDNAEQLRAGDGGGTTGGMEARIARLEADMDHVKRDVAELRSDMKTVLGKLGNADTRFATLEERISHLPDKGFIVKSAMTTLAFLAALTVFADKLQALIK